MINIYYITMGLVIIALALLALSDAHNNGGEPRT